MIEARAGADGLVAEMGRLELDMADGTVFGIFQENTR